MRHEWEHPEFEKSTFSIENKNSINKKQLSDFDNPTEKEAISYLDELAIKCNISYTKLIDHLKDYIRSGGHPYVQKGSQNMQDSFYEIDEEYFRKCLKVAEDIEYDPKDMFWSNPFSCSC